MITPSAATNIGILIFDDVEVLDFAGPYEVFSRTRLQPGLASRLTEESAPFKVFTVAKSLDPVVAIGSLEVIPQYQFSNCPPIDLLVVPGGWGTRRLLEDHDTLQWIARVGSKAARVTSVCTGSLLLAKAGFLAGLRATTHWGAIDLLAGIDETIEVERDIRVVDSGPITSAGVAAGIDMALYAVELLCGRAVANDTARYMDYPAPSLSDSISENIDAGRAPKS